MIELTYFKPVEFTACVPSCSILQMDENFLHRLDRARKLSGVPFILTSAYRSPEWDISKGRSGTGYHTKGRAVDVACDDSHSRACIVRGCLLAGLSCGISDTFIHIDERRNQIIFLY